MASDKILDCILLALFHLKIFEDVFVPYDFFDNFNEDKPP